MPCSYPWWVLLLSRLRPCYRPARPPSKAPPILNSALSARRRLHLPGQPRQDTSDMRQASISRGACWSWRRWVDYMPSNINRQPADPLRRKSQIAIEYAYQVRGESPTTWVFWVHAGTQARFEEGYRRIAETTRMDGWDNPKADVLRLVRNWLCDESNGRWVMVIDNADDSAVFFSPLDRTQAAGVGGPGRAVEPLSDFLPQSPNGSILITSRSRDVARRLTGRGDCLMEVKPMDKCDALALLQKKLSFNANEHDAIE